MDGKMVVTSSSMGRKKTEEKAPLPAKVFKWAPLPFKKNKFQVPLLTVEGALAWALFTAVATIAVGFAITTAAVEFANLYSTVCREIVSPSWCPDPTPEQEAAPLDWPSFWAGALFGFLWDGTAMVGLHLPRRYARTRWGLAFLAVVTATVAHCVLCLVVLASAADHPGDFANLGGAATLLVAVAGDLFGLLSLLIGGTDQ